MKDTIGKHGIQQLNLCENLQASIPTVQFLQGKASDSKDFSSPGMQKPARLSLGGYHSSNIS